MKQAVKDAAQAQKTFLQGVHGKPRFKSRHKSKISFYVNYESLKRKPNGFHGEKIGYVKTAKPLPIAYKAEAYDITLVKADRFFPSSKTCHVCGFIKKDLKLKDRTYRCPVCGEVIDRDVNAAINLANYAIHEQETYLSLLGNLSL